MPSSTLPDNTTKSLKPKERRHHIEPTKRSTIYIPEAIHKRLVQYKDDHPGTNMNEIIMTAALKFLDDADLDKTTKRLYTNKLVATINSLKDDISVFLQSNVGTDTQTATIEIMKLLIRMMTFSIMMTAEVDQKLSIIQDPTDITLTAYDSLERFIRDYAPILTHLSEEIQQSIAPKPPK